MFTSLLVYFKCLACFDLLLGIDGTKAFISGDFNKVGLVDDIDGLTDEECVALADWIKLYENEYTLVGKVIGNFYDKDGKETAALKDFQEKLKKGLEAKEKDSQDKMRFPECNSKWTKEEGAKVWCTNERYVAEKFEQLWYNQMPSIRSIFIRNGKLKFAKGLKNSWKQFM